MPTYDYVCDECSYEFEEFHSISAEPIKICPQCGHLSVKRKISGGTGLIFKGSGFYITDYAKKNSSADKGKNQKEKTKNNKAERKATASDKAQVGKAK